MALSTADSGLRSSCPSIARNSFLRRSAFRQLGNLRAQLVLNLLAHRHFGFEQLRFLLQEGDAALALIDIGQRA